ncbi:hypothetical protein DFJ73DRAFT_765124 [Zopfochytrium polystomum]|nr:hypothetical protein DFJ73DRAFT_765124 [Zopfochytrium polystomum]
MNSRSPLPPSSTAGSAAPPPSVGSSAGRPRDFLPGPVAARNPSGAALERRGSDRAKGSSRWRAADSAPSFKDDQFVAYSPTSPSQPQIPYQVGFGGGPTPPARGFQPPPRTHPFQPPPGPPFGAGPPRQPSSPSMSPFILPHQRQPPPMYPQPKYYSPPTAPQHVQPVPMPPQYYQPIPVDNRGADFLYQQPHPQSQPYYQPQPYGAYPDPYRNNGRSSPPPARSDSVRRARPGLGSQPTPYNPGPPPGPPPGPLPGPLREQRELVQNAPTHSQNPPYQQPSRTDRDESDSAQPPNRKNNSRHPKAAPATNAPATNATTANANAKGSDPSSSEQNQRKRTSRSNPSKRPPQPIPVDDPEFEDCIDDFLALFSDDEISDPLLRPYMRELLARWGRWTERRRAPHLCFEAAALGGMRYLEENAPSSSSLIPSRETRRGSSNGNGPASVIEQIERALANAIAGLTVDELEPDATPVMRAKAVALLGDEFLSRAASPKLANQARRRAKHRRSRFVSGVAGNGGDSPDTSNAGTGATNQGQNREPKGRDARERPDRVNHDAERDRRRAANGPGGDESNPSRQEETGAHDIGQSAKRPQVAGEPRSRRGSTEGEPRQRRADERRRMEDSDLQSASSSGPSERRRRPDGSAYRGDSNYQTSGPNANVRVSPQSQGHIQRSDSYRRRRDDSASNLSSRGPSPDNHFLAVSGPNYSDASTAPPGQLQRRPSANALSPSRAASPGSAIRRQQQPPAQLQPPLYVGSAPGPTSPSQQVVHRRGSNSGPAGPPPRGLDRRAGGGNPTSPTGAYNPPLPAASSGARPPQERRGSADSFQRSIPPPRRRPSDTSNYLPAALNTNQAASSSHRHRQQQQQSGVSNVSVFHGAVREDDGDDYDEEPEVVVIDESSPPTSPRETRSNNIPHHHHQHHHNFAHGAPGVAGVVLPPPDHFTRFDPVASDSDDEDDNGKASNSSNAPRGANNAGQSHGAGSSARAGAVPSGSRRPSAGAIPAAGAAATGGPPSGASSAAGTPAVPLSSLWQSVLDEVDDLMDSFGGGKRK